MRHRLKEDGEFFLFLAIIIVLLSAFILFTRAKETTKTGIAAQDTTTEIVCTETTAEQITVKINLTAYETTTEIETTVKETQHTTKETQREVSDRPQTPADSGLSYAEQIWSYLRNDMGLTKYVAAGIMGNIMTECGGQTLDIQPYITNSSGHYGICQWNLGYFPEVRERDLQGQLEFLNSTIKWILNDYGDRYYEGFNYNLFINITDEQVAAEAFAYAYEGCGAGNCSRRRLNHATTALNYFEGTTNG